MEEKQKPAPQRMPNISMWSIEALAQLNDSGLQLLDDKSNKSFKSNALYILYLVYAAKTSNQKCIQHAAQFNIRPSSTDTEKNVCFRESLKTSFESANFDKAKELLKSFDGTFIMKGGLGNDLISSALLYSCKPDFLEFLYQQFIVYNQMFSNVDAVIDNPDSHGLPPLISAVLGRNVKCVEKLLQMGAKVNSHDTHSFDLASLSLIIDDKFCYLKDKLYGLGKTALIYAICIGDMNCVKLLLDYHPNLTRVCKRGITSFGYAAITSNSDCLDMLLTKAVKLKEEAKASAEDLKEQIIQKDEVKFPEGKKTRASRVFSKPLKTHNRALKNITKRFENPNRTVDNNTKDLASTPFNFELGSVKSVLEQAVNNDGAVGGTNTVIEKGGDTTTGANSIPSINSQISDPTSPFSFNRGDFEKENKNVNGFQFSLGNGNKMNFNFSTDANKSQVTGNGLSSAFDFNFNANEMVNRSSFLSFGETGLQSNKNEIDFEFSLPSTSSNKGGPNFTISTRDKLKNVANNEVPCSETTTNKDDVTQIQSTGTTKPETVLADNKDQTLEQSVYDSFPYAILGGNAKCLELLINQSDEFNSKSVDSQRLNFLLKVAGKVKQKKMIEVLLKRTECDSDKNKTMIMITAERGLPDCLTMLLKNSDKSEMETKNVFKETALMFAIRNGHADCLRILLENGADIETLNGCDQTPLIAAVLFLKQNCVDVLLEFHPYLFQKDKTGKSALMYAGTFGNLDCAESILKALKDKTNIRDGNMKNTSILGKELEGNVNGVTNGFENDEVKVNEKTNACGNGELKVTETTNYCDNGEVKVNEATNYCDNGEVKMSGVINDCDYSEANVNETTNDYEHGEVKLNGATNDCDNREVKVNETTDDCGNGDLKVNERTNYCDNVEDKVNEATNYCGKVKVNETINDYDNNEGKLNEATNDCDSGEVEVNKTKSDCDHDEVKVNEKRDDCDNGVVLVIEATNDCNYDNAKLTNESDSVLNPLDDNSPCSSNFTPETEKLIREEYLYAVFHRQDDKYAELFRRHFPNLSVSLSEDEVSQAVKEVFDRSLGINEPAMGLICDSKVVFDLYEIIELVSIQKVINNPDILLSLLKSQVIVKKPACIVMDKDIANFNIRGKKETESIEHLMNFKLFEWKSWTRVSNVRQIVQAAVRTGITPGFIRTRSPFSSSYDFLKSPMGYAIEEDEPLARFLLVNLYFTLADYRQIISCERLTQKLSEITKPTHCNNKGHRIWSLETICLLTVSTALFENQSELSRSKQVDCLPIPDKFKSILKFKGMHSELPIKQWKDIGKAELNINEDILLGSKVR